MSKNSATVIFCMKILNMYALCICTILTLPIFNIFWSFLLCYKESPMTQNFECYEGVYIVHLVVSIAGLALSLIFSLTFTLLYIDLNPCSQLPFAAPQSRLNVFRLLLKIVIPLWFTVFLRSVTWVIRKACFCIWM